MRRLSYRTPGFLSEFCELMRFSIAFSFLVSIVVLTCGCGTSLPEGMSPDASKGYVAPLGHDAIAKTKSLLKKAKH